jgi:rubrerythrin
LETHALNALAEIMRRSDWRLRQQARQAGAWVCRTCHKFAVSNEDFGGPTTTRCPFCGKLGTLLWYNPVQPAEFLTALR